MSGPHGPHLRHAKTGRAMLKLHFKEQYAVEDLECALEELKRKGFVIPCRSHEGCVILPRGI